MITSVGVDLVSISRLTRLLSKVASLEKNIFTLQERELPIRSKAGNIAVKEAMVKAGIIRGFKSFTEIEICREINGAPRVVKENKSIKFSFEKSIDILVSISYLNDTALALVICKVSCEE
jgi:phosphopantetheine--protein transferase-like protein